MQWFDASGGLDWIDWTWSAGALLMALAAAAKFKAESQPKGALVVFVLGLGQVAAILAGQDTLAYLTSLAIVIVAGLLIAVERRWKAKRAATRGKD